jgi:ribonuclease HI
MKELIKRHASVSTPVPQEIWEKIENKETKTKDDIRDIQEISLYTDGSCKENDNKKEKTQPAGWGVAVIEGRIDNEGKATKEGKLTNTLYGPLITDLHKEFFLGTEIASNNTGELTAICEGLLWLKDHEKTRRPVAFYYDSKYASKVTTGEYRANENKHLAATARALLKLVMEQRTVRFEHVKGHSNDRWNDEADELANTGATGKQCNKGRYEGTQGEQTQDTSHNTTHQVTSNTTITTNTNKQKEDIRRLNDNRLINIRIQEKDRIQIPKPTYGQGANRRARFAFGKITTEQAKQNTALHAKELQKNLSTEKEHEEEKEQETEEEQGK